MGGYRSRAGGAGQISPRDFLRAAFGTLVRRESFCNVRRARIGGCVKDIARRREAVIA
jgi:hypothetical protein